MLHPVPRTEELPGQGDWFTSARKHFRRRRWLKKPYEAFKRWCGFEPTSRLVRSIRKVSPSGRLLDVGAGTGPILKLARPYYDCVGLDPSPIAATKLRESGFEVIESTFEEATIESSSFDIVTLDSVIEHVLSPDFVIAKINRILRPNGIVILKTPKFGGPAYRRHGSEWNGFRHGYHTFLFSGATLTASLEKNGFEVLKKPKRDRMLDDILILYARKIRECDEHGSQQRSA